MATSLAVKVAGAALLASAVAGAGAATWHQAAPSCVLGKFNAAATVTVSGLGAGHVCEATAARGGGYYVRTAPVPASDVVLCEVNAQGLHWTVRDQGAFMFVGRTVCDNMRRTAARGG